MPSVVRGPKERRRNAYVDPSQQGLAADNYCRLVLKTSVDSSFRRRPKSTTLLHEPCRERAGTEVGRSLSTFPIAFRFQFKARYKAIWTKSSPTTAARGSASSSDQANDRSRALKTFRPLRTDVCCRPACAQRGGPSSNICLPHASAARTQSRGARQHRRKALVVPSNSAYRLEPSAHAPRGRHGRIHSVLTHMYL
ncbi:hypothetical protein PsYK624_158030 [Phanerochaete sordida]|uniref:Uncharacterized protein n=1 Tax=Phanerochaete sordida TaxID=48140 RepID=A0A9P3LLH3_9APHY|nr:hypothetical protein PsYK624_158030 [Phanerochaete sordida]